MVTSMDGPAPVTPGRPIAVSQVGRWPRHLVDAVEAASITVRLK
jgi:hypothetical protein